MVKAHILEICSVYAKIKISANYCLNTVIWLEISPPTLLLELRRAQGFLILKYKKTLCGGVAEWLKATVC